jgi:hypothetical protein
MWSGHKITTMMTNWLLQHLIHGISIKFSHFHMPSIMGVIHPSIRNYATSPLEFRNGLKKYVTLLQKFPSKQDIALSEGGGSWFGH